MSEIFIKNMVCPRCIMAVEDALDSHGLEFERVELGKVILEDPVDAARLQPFESTLQRLGFEVLKDKDVQKIEKIKNLLHAELQKEKVDEDFNLSGMVKAHFSEDYSRLSNLFSSMQGMTIEKYFIQLKIEKAKELLFYQELTLSEMAWQLGYSSVQHLSTQFKKVTGMTPSDYKKLKIKPRRGMDQI